MKISKPKTITSRKFKKEEIEYNFQYQIDKKRRITLNSNSSKFNPVYQSSKTKNNIILLPKFLPEGKTTVKPATYKECRDKLSDILYFGEKSIRNKVKDLSKRDQNNFWKSKIALLEFRIKKMNNSPDVKKWALLTIKNFYNSFLEIIDEKITVEDLINNTVGIVIHMDEYPENLHIFMVPTVSSYYDHVSPRKVLNVSSFFKNTREYNKFLKMIEN